MFVFPATTVSLGVSLHAWSSSPCARESGPPPTTRHLPAKTETAWLTRWDRWFWIALATVSRILQTVKRPPSQTWKSFLQNHLGKSWRRIFFTVPTVSMRVLFAIYGHEFRRRIQSLGMKEVMTA